MKSGSFTGLPLFFPEDHAVLVSSGAIRDRSKELLGPADVAIARLYRALLRLADEVGRGQSPKPLSVDPLTVRGLHGIVEEGTSWKDLVPGHVRLERGARRSEHVASPSGSASAHGFVAKDGVGTRGAETEDVDVAA